MKLKKKIQTLEAEVSELKSQLQRDRLILIDQTNPKLSVLISLQNGAFLVEKITTEIKQTPELIINDSK